MAGQRKGTVPLNAEAIKREMSRKGMIVDELASRVGYSPRQIARYLSGKSSPEDALAGKMADALGVPKRVIVSDQHAPPEGHSIGLELRITAVARTADQVSKAVLALEELRRLLGGVGLEILSYDIRHLAESLVKPKSPAFVRAETREIGFLSIRLAELGLNQLAFNLLVEKFKESSKHALGDAMALVPYMLYFGYRYAKLDQLASVLTASVSPTIRSQVPKEENFLEDRTRALCLLQVAMLCTETGYPQLAGGIFQSKAIVDALEGETELFWPRSQLIRARAAFAAIYEGRSVAEHWLGRAKELGRDETNRRAVATLQYTADTQFESEKGRRVGWLGWTAMEEFYRPARTAILNRLQSSSPLPADLLHLYSAFSLGAIAPAQARAEYPDSDYREDLVGLQACRDLGDEFRIDDEKVRVSLIGPRAGKLMLLRNSSFRPLLSDVVRESLNGFEQLIRPK